MQLAQHEGAGQVETTPDRRLGVHQIDPHPEAPHPLRHLPHLRRRLIQHPRERIAAGVRHQRLEQRQVHTPDLDTLLFLFRLFFDTPSQSRREAAFDRNTDPTADGHRRSPDPRQFARRQ